MPRITISQESYDRIILTQGARQTVGESLAELLAERQRLDDALYEVALALPQSAAGIAFSDSAVPGFTVEIIRYVTERARNVVLPGQTLPPLTPYRAELVEDAPLAGQTSPVRPGDPAQPEAPRVVGKSVWEWLRSPAV